MTDEVTLTQRNNWNAIADDWSQHFDWTAKAFRPVIDWVCDATALAPGKHVLDIACGTGMPALAVAERVQPSGSVVATDLSREMLRVTAARAATKGLGNISFIEMDAQEIEFADQSFDAVTCAFGLMFCPNPERALQGIRRVLKPGGKFALTTWAPPAENSFITVYGRAVAEVLALPRYDRAAPGPFRLADSAELEAMIRSVGFREVDVVRRPQPVIYESVEVYQQISETMTPGFRKRLHELAEPDALRLRELVQKSAAPFARNGTVQLLATPLCATGSR